MLKDKIDWPLKARMVMEVVDVLLHNLLASGEASCYDLSSL